MLIEAPAFAVTLRCRCGCGGPTEPLQFLWPVEAQAVDASGLVLRLSFGEWARLRLWPRLWRRHAMGIELGCSRILLHSPTELQLVGRDLVIASPWWLRVVS